MSEIGNGVSCSNGENNSAGALEKEVENGEESLVLPEEHGICEDSAKIFITDAEDDEDKVVHGPKVSTLKSQCLGQHDAGSSKSQSTNAENSEITSDDNSEESKDNNNHVRNEEQVLLTAFDDMSVITSGSEETKETGTSYNLQAALDPINDPEWKNFQRHIFVISESGKPIYSRYGNEDQLVTLFGLMQALVYFVHDNEDSIRSITAGETRIVFLHKSPLILVCVTRLSECVAQVQNHLTYFYNQIVSILTSKQLVAIFEKRKNYDLRRLLSGSERLLNNLGDLAETDPSFTLGAVKCLPLPSAVRETISQTIIQNLSKSKNVVFAILVGSNQLISLVRMKKCFMHPVDLHIILNLIDSSESFKSAESWTPICLPRFDSSGFIHAHVSYLADDCQACLVLLTVDRESFFALSEAKQKIVERLRRHNCLEAINTSMTHPWPTMTHVNVPEVRHFIHKSKSIAQFVEPTLSIPYEGLKTKEKTSSDRSNGSPVQSQRQRIYSMYFKMHARLHSHTRPLKLVYWVSDHENWIGWLTSTFELYVAFEPLVKKSAAIEAVNKLLKWIKREEDRIFIMNSPTF